jgi:hypothetical protein
MGRKVINRGAGAAIKLEEGTALYMGDGMFVIDTIDDTRPGDARFQRVALSRQDLETLLAAA